MLRRIEKLKLTQFRGGCRPVVFDFHPDKSIVLIYGENGAGKSSIADAIDFVCNNEFGSLRDRSGTTPRTHVVSVGGQAQELAVKMRCGGKDWEARLQGGKPVTQPVNPPRAFILRRTDITRVMEAAPAERYKTLHAYITVANVEGAEGELRKAYKAVQDTVERAVQTRQQAAGTLESLWRKEGSPGSEAGGTAEQWAIRKTSVRVDAQRLTLEANRRLVAGIEGASSARGAWQTALGRAAAAAAASAAAQAALHAAAAEQAGGGAALLVLLTDARRYLSGADAGADACPLCGGRAETAALLERVEDQLGRLSELQRLAEAEQGAQQAQAQVQGALAGAQEALVQQCRRLGGLALDAGAEYGELVDAGALAAASGDEARLAAALAALDGLAALQATLAAAIADDEKTIYLWNALQTHLQAIGEAERTVRDQETLAGRLKAILAVAEAERKDYVDQLVRAISSDVNALYARIHPHEPLGGSSLYVKPNVAGSLELRATFGGATDVVPGAYYSEAHLDTLGLCVYLALARRGAGQGGGQIVVLDDVLTSVDEAHLERIIALLAEEAERLGQLIVTTHSRPLFDRMCAAQGIAVDLIELHGWDPMEGIRYSRVTQAG